MAKISCWYHSTLAELLELTEGFEYNMKVKSAILTDACNKYPTQRTPAVGKFILENLGLQSRDRICLYSNYDDGKGSQLVEYCSCTISFFWMGMSLLSQITRTSMFEEDMVNRTI